MARRSRGYKLPGKDYADLLRPLGDLPVGFAIPIDGWKIKPICHEITPYVTLYFNKNQGSIAWKRRPFKINGLWMEYD